MSNYKKITQCNSIVTVIFVIGILISSNIYAAAFKSPESLINIPAGEKYTMGDLDFSIATGLNSLKKYQFDLSINYAISEYFKGGVTMINYKKAVLNCQGTFIELEKFGRLRVTGGVLNISSESDLNSWDDEPSVNSNNLMHFFVGSRDLLWGRVHIGIAKRRQNNKPKLLNGFLFGYSKPVKKTMVIIEFDGVAANVGLQRINPEKTVLIKGAISGPIISLGEAEKTNLLSIQMTRRFNVFSRYSKTLEILEEEYDSFKLLEKDFQEMKINLDNEIEELKKSKNLLIKEVEKLQSRELGEVDPKNMEELSEDQAYIQGYSKDIQAMMYYQQAEEFYKDKSYYKAIKQLELAIESSPQEQQFYIELGSIYFKLKSKRKAYKIWAEAYEIDPTEKTFRKMPKLIKQEILKIIEEKKQISKQNNNIKRVQ